MSRHCRHTSLIPTFCNDLEEGGGRGKGRGGGRGAEAEASLTSSSPLSAKSLTGQSGLLPRKSHLKILNREQTKRWSNPTWYLYWILWVFVHLEITSGPLDSNWAWNCRPVSKSCLSGHYLPDLHLSFSLLIIFPEPLKGVSSLCCSLKVGRFCPVCFIQVLCILLTLLW